VQRENRTSERSSAAIGIGGSATKFDTDSRDYGGGRKQASSSRKPDKNSKRWQRPDPFLDTKADNDSNTLPGVDAATTSAEAGNFRSMKDAVPDPYEESSETSRLQPSQAQLHSGYGGAAGAPGNRPQSWEHLSGSRSTSVQAGQPGQDSVPQQEGQSNQRQQADGPQGSPSTFNPYSGFSTSHHENAAMAAKQTQDSGKKQPKASPSPPSDVKREAGVTHGPPDAGPQAAQSGPGAPAMKSVIETPYRDVSESAYMNPRFVQVNDSENVRDPHGNFQFNP
jgi:hypothetical protein